MKKTRGRDDQCWESASDAQSRRCGDCRRCKWGFHESHLSGDFALETSPAMFHLFSLWTCSRSECNSSQKRRVGNTGDSLTLQSPYQGEQGTQYPSYWIGNLKYGPLVLDCLTLDQVNEKGFDDAAQGGGSGCVVEGSLACTSTLGHLRLCQVQNSF